MKNNDAKTILLLAISLIATGIATLPGVMKLMNESSPIFTTCLLSTVVLSFILLYKRINQKTV